MKTVIPVPVPASKSMTNRALAIAAMTDGESAIRNPLLADDTEAFAAALAALGVTIRKEPGVWWVQGLGELQEIRTDVWLQDAGTAARFLPPLAAAFSGTFRFDASQQLRDRPLSDLLEALERLGARFELSSSSSGLPFILRSSGLRGGRLELPGSTSSQFLSGLLMSAPLAADEIVIRVPDLVSRPYVTMTERMMRQAGVVVGHRDSDTYVVAPGEYIMTDWCIEPDASSASYFLAAAALTGETVRVAGLTASSLQGDHAFSTVLRLMGAEAFSDSEATVVTGPQQLTGGFVVDMSDISDTFMTLAVIAPFADAPVRITGIGHARRKESDRLTATVENLQACGVQVTAGQDWIQIEPSDPHGGLILCHRDHRLAMAFSILGLAIPGVVLDDPECVSKTYPGFHRDLADAFPGR